MGFIAYLWLRSKRGDSVFEDNSLKKVEYDSLKSQEAYLTKELETDIAEDIEVLQNSQRLASIDSGNSSYYKESGLFNHTDIFVSTNARNQYDFFNKKANEQKSIFSQALKSLESNLNEANQIIYTQNFYNQPTLTDIRQRLNSEEFRDIV